MGGGGPWAPIPRMARLGPRGHTGGRARTASQGGQTPACPRMMVRLVDAAKPPPGLGRAKHWFQPRVEWVEYPTPPPPPPGGAGGAQRGLGGGIGMPWSMTWATAPSPGRPTPGVVKQDKSCGGSVDTTKTRSDPQRVGMCKGQEANRRCQRQTNQHHPLVPNPPWAPFNNQAPLPPPPPQGGMGSPSPLPPPFMAPRSCPATSP